VIYFLVDRASAFTMRDFVELHAPGLADLVEIVHYEDLLQRQPLHTGTYIFSALDHLTPGGMRVVRELIDELRDPAAESRVLNDPARVLLRYELLDTLHRRGLNRHGVARARDSRSPLRFPVFVREESEHNGAISPLLHDPTELRRALGKSVLRGYRLRDLLVVEYCDTAEPNGRYRRYSAFVVSGRVIARELMVGDEWMLKSHGNAPTESEIRDELEYVRGNTHADEIEPIFSLAGIDYGRIDYALLDGRIETWEINTNPTIRRGRQADPIPIPPEINKLRDPMRAHFTSALEAALRSVDTRLPPRPLAVRFSTECLRNATPMIHVSKPTWLRHVASAIRPALPRLNRLIDVVSPYVTRAARQLRS
jgi:hypothetical protein